MYDMAGLMSAAQSGIKEIASWVSVNDYIYVSLFKTKSLKFYYFGTSSFRGDYIRFTGSGFYAVKDGKYSVSRGNSVKIVDLKAGGLIASELDAGTQLVYICKL